MSEWKVFHEKWKCIGCGACAAIEPKHWEMQGDKAHLLESADGPDPDTFEKNVVELDANQEAADSCPVNCIHVKKKEE